METLSVAGQVEAHRAAVLSVLLEGVDEESSSNLKANIVQCVVIGKHP
jgi:hypothetical protein